LRPLTQGSGLDDPGPKVYRRAKSPLIADADLREVAAKRELYRRLARTSDDLREVAERVWYSALKQR
jgi:hypothetical protein